MEYFEPGKCLNHDCYRITGFLGQGGFGITYLGEEIGFIRKSGYGEEYVKLSNPERIVIKELNFVDINHRDATRTYPVFPKKSLEFEKLINKHLEEGRILKGLNHNNIVKTRDIFRENDTAYMVMDFVDGENLEDIIRRSGKMGKDEALKVILDVLSAVEYIHSKKILHLDISPGNILRRKIDGRAILVDFGASLTYGENNHVASTTSKLVTGRKEHYSPNEQGEIDNLKEFDATFDTYAVGATLYFLLTGTAPPPSGLVASGRITLTPPSGQMNAGEADGELDRVVLKAMNYRYPERYFSAAEMQRDLRGIYDPRKATEDGMAANEKTMPAAKKLQETPPEKPVVNENTALVGDENTTLVGNENTVLVGDDPKAPPGPNPVAARQKTPAANPKSVAANPKINAPATYNKPSGFMRIADFTSSSIAVIIGSAIGSVLLGWVGTTLTIYIAKQLNSPIDPSFRNTLYWIWTIPLFIFFCIRYWGDTD